MMVRDDNKRPIFSPTCSHTHRGEPMSQSPSHPLGWVFSKMARGCGVGDYSPTPPPPRHLGVCGCALPRGCVPPVCLGPGRCLGCASGLPRVCGGASGMLRVCLGLPAGCVSRGCLGSPHVPPPSQCDNVLYLLCAFTGVSLCSSVAMYKCQFVQVSSHGYRFK